MADATVFVVDDIMILLYGIQIVTYTRTVRLNETVSMNTNTTSALHFILHANYVGLWVLWLLLLQPDYERS